MDGWNDLMAKRASAPAKRASTPLCSANVVWIKYNSAPGTENCVIANTIYRETIDGLWQCIKRNGIMIPAGTESPMTSELLDPKYKRKQTNSNINVGRSTNVSNYKQSTITKSHDKPTQTNIKSHNEQTKPQRSKYNEENYIKSIKIGTVINGIPQDDISLE